MNTTGQPQIAAYAIHLSAPSLAFSSRPRIYLTYAPGTTFTNSTPRIFIYDPAQSSWQVLPLSASGPGRGGNTLEALLPATLNSGDVLAIFADAVPPRRRPKRLIIVLTGGVSHCRAARTRFTRTVSCQQNHPSSCSGFSRCSPCSGWTSVPRVLSARPSAIQSAATRLVFTTVISPTVTVKVTGHQR